MNGGMKPISRSIEEDTLKKWMDIAVEISYGAVMRYRPDEEDLLEKAYMKLRVQAGDLARDIAKELGISIATHNMNRIEDGELISTIYIYTGSNYGIPNRRYCVRCWANHPRANCGLHKKRKVKRRQDKW